MNELSLFLLNERSVIFGYFMPILFGIDVWRKVKHVFKVCPEVRGRGFVRCSGVVACRL